MPTTSDDKDRDRFAALVVQRDAIRATSGPLRAARDALVQEAETTARGMNAEIRAAEAGLFEIDEEIAKIARGLKGKTGRRARAAE